MRIKGVLDESRYRKYQKEVSIMRSLRHPNIVEFMGISLQQEDVATQEPAKLCIVTELLPNGNLEQLLTRRKLSWKRYFRFAKDIAIGLNWLHHKGIIHRDLKPSNLLITANYRVCFHCLYLKRHRLRLLTLDCLMLEVTLMLNLGFTVFVERGAI